MPPPEIAGGELLKRDTSNTRFWRLAINPAGSDRPLRMHDLRPAHAS
jgi:hypothetical protein